MIALLIITHGGLARELVAAARRIVPGAGPLDAVTIDWEDDPEECHARIARAIEIADQGDGVILATDMFGGTPTNIALSFLEEGKVEVVTGVNLPMVIKFTNLHAEATSLHEVARTIADRGRGAIRVAGEIIARPREE